MSIRMLILVSMGCPSAIACTPSDESGRSRLRATEEDASASEALGKQGTIRLMPQSRLSGEEVVVDYFAFADFVVGEVRETDSSDCEIVTEGACTLVACESAEEFPFNGIFPGEPRRGTGDIVLDGLSEAVTLSQGVDGRYPSVRFTERPFGDGETVTASGMGGELISSYSLDVEAPSLLTVTEPIGLDPLEPVEMDREADLEVAWSGGDHGTVLVSLDVYDDENVDAAYVVSCEVPASAGMASIPKSLLPRVERYASLGVMVVAAEGAEVDGWSLLLEVNDGVAGGEVVFTK